MMYYFCFAQAQASYVAGFPVPLPLPRAHPSSWTRTQGLSHRDSHAPPFFGTTPVRMWTASSVLHAASYLALFFGDFVRLACFAQLLIQSAAARRLLKPKLTASSE